MFKIPDMVELSIVFIPIILAIIGALIIPNKTAIIKGEVAKYEGGKSAAVYAIGIIVILFTFFYLWFVTVNQGDFDWLAGVNGVFFISVGIGLIIANHSINRAIKDRSMETMMATDIPAPIGAVQSEVISGREEPAGLRTSAISQIPGSKGQAGRVDDIQVQVRLPISQQEHKQKVLPQTAKREMKVGCPKCNGVIKLDTSKPITKIRCPFCGFEGGMG